MWRPPECIYLGMIVFDRFIDNTHLDILFFHRSIDQKLSYQDEYIQDPRALVGLVGFP